LFLITGVMMVVAAPASAAKAPQGKTYFVVTLGLDEGGGGPFGVGAGCLRFASGGGFYCERGALCGSWERVTGAGQTSQQTAFKVELQMEDDETGNPIFVDGFGRVDDRGPMHTISIVAQAREPVSGYRMNFGFVGKPTKWNRCASLVEEFENGD
jgi:hypothetical protein